MKYYYVVTRPENAPKDWTGKVGRIDETMIKDVVPDVAERIFYLSGPNEMVESYKSLLRKIGVPNNHIKTDFFPGF
jgi:ferredoxin-NADP reductase